MPRPSVKKERTEEILQAFERCVAAYGVEGATLERLAEEAGLRRSLIRHYVGNRDELINALLERYIRESDRQTALLMNNLPEKNAAETMVEYLFDDSYYDHNYSLVGAALYSATASLPHLTPPLQASVNSFIDAIAELLSQTHAHSDQEDRYAVATGIVSIYFNIESMEHLGDTGQWRNAAKRSAHLLLKALC